MTTLKPVDSTLSISIFKDGSDWFAVRTATFESIQESTFGHGPTPQTALLHLLREELKAEHARLLGDGPDAAAAKHKIFLKVKDMLVEHLGIDSARIELKADAVTDLGADSLDVVRLVMAFEEEFNLKIPDADAEKIMTVNDIVSYIFSRQEDKSILRMERDNAIEQRERDVDAISKLKLERDQAIQNAKKAIEQLKGAEAKCGLLDAQYRSAKASFQAELEKQAHRHGLESANYESAARKLRADNDFLAGRLKEAEERLDACRKDLDACRKEVASHHGF